MIQENKDRNPVAAGATERLREVAQHDPGEQGSKPASAAWHRPYELSPSMIQENKDRNRPRLSSAQSGRESPSMIQENKDRNQIRQFSWQPS